MKNAIKKRIKFTGSGKIRRRAMGIGHSKTTKNANQLLRKKGAKTLGLSARTINKHLK